MKIQQVSIVALTLAATLGIARLQYHAQAQHGA
jgi:hypothetical protein